jgi:microcystin-dependent protein
MGVTSGSVSTSAYQGRYYLLEWSCTQSVENNQSTISWTLKAVGGQSSWYAERALTLVIGGVTAYSKSERVERYAGVVATGTRVVNHNGTGDAHIDISIQAAVYTSAVNVSGSGSFDLANIPRVSSPTLSASSVEFGKQITIYSNRKSSGFTHHLYASLNGGSMNGITSGIGDSYTWTVPANWMDYLPNSTSATITLRLYTFSGNTNIGYKDILFTATVPASIKPSIALSVTEATAINWGVYVQGNSKLDVAITPTTKNGATIKSYKTTIDGKSYTAKDFTTDILKNSGNLDIISTITDSRGRTATYNGTIEVLPYNPPTIKNMSVVRCNSDGTNNTKGAYAKVTYDYAFASIGGKNNLEVVAQYKTKSASAYTTHATDNYTSASLEGTTTEVFAASTTSNYDIQIVATDAICELFGKASPKAIASIGTISTFFSMFKQTVFSFGKVCDTAKKNALEIGWDIYDKYDTQIRNGMAAYSSAGIDANTTLEHHILTQTNTPNGTFHHVITYFYNDKTSTSNRVQMAIPYKTPTVTYHRYYLNGEWSAWLHEGLSAYPIGGYYISHNDTSPAELFGGTWHRIESRFLWACPATSEIGLTGGERDHTLTVNEIPPHSHEYYSPVAQTVSPSSSGTTYGNYNKQYMIGTSTTGGGAAHNNMPPYVNVAIWRRTA